MKQAVILVLVVFLTFSGCTSAPNSNPKQGTISQNIKVSTEKASSETTGSIQSQDNSLPIAGLSKRFNIEFSYVNNVYGYDLQAKWNDVEIKAEAPRYASGLEILLDGTPQMFEECDLNHSETITQDEWADYEEEILFNVLDLNTDGELPIEEFQYFTGQLNGVELAPGWHSISQPKNADYAIAVDDFDAPVYIKILRAGEGGFNAGSGTVFPEGTIFMELESAFEVQLKAMPDFELPPGFLTPLLSMYLEQDYENNNHGALGFSSIVDTQAFNGIYGGTPFTLDYVGKGESGVLDEYHLTIMPIN